METRHLMGAALAAWLSAAAMAQDPARPSADVEARLSAAALAEARGEYEVALRELQEATRIADDASRPRIQAAVTALAQRHRPGASPQRAPGQDPVLDLIEALDRGTAEDAAVHAAMRQLQQLGALVVPTVLKQLPELGPFGLLNTIELLAPIDDPRIAPALLQLLDKGDASVAIAVARALESMTPTTAHTLAVALAADNRPVPAQLAALEKLLEQDAEPTIRERLVERLLKVPAAHADLLGLIERRFSLGDRVLERLANEAPGDTRHRARHYLLLHGDLTEAQALAGLELLPPAWRGAAASDLAGSHDDWARVGIAAITATPPQGFDRSWFRTMQWWRAGDDAAAALLSTLPHLGQARRTGASSTNPRDVDDALRSMVAHGWRMSPKLEAAMAAMAVDKSWGIFVAALPEDGEDRALAVLEQQSPGNRVAIFTAALAQERRWNRLFVACLDAVEGPQQLQQNMLERDWRGLDAATTQRFAQVVGRWQAEWPPLDPRRRNATSVNTGQSVIDWRMSLCNAARLFDLPVAVLQPLVDAHDAQAWGVLAQLEPRAALDCAATWPDTSEIASNVLRTVVMHGDQRDVPLYATATRSEKDAGHNPGGPSTADFLERHGAGQLAVIELASFDRSPRCAADQQIVAEARRAAHSARFADLDALTALLPSLDQDVAAEVLNALELQLTRENAPQLVAAAERLLRDEQPRFNSHCTPPAGLVARMLRSLCTVGAVEALPIAHQLLARRDLNLAISHDAAIAVAALSTEDREAALAALLADDRTYVVELTLATEDLGAFPTLWPKVEQAIRRNRATIDSLDVLLDQVDRERRRALATALLSDEQLPQTSRGICESCLRALGAEKNGEFATTLARGAKHPDSRVRLTAADALGSTFAKEAVPFLIDLLRDDDEQVRKHANDRLAEIANYFEAKQKWSDLLK